MKRYIVFKQTTSHADGLAAIGAADLLRHLSPRIVESEDRFEIRLQRNVLPSDVDAIDPGFSYLLRPRQKAPALPPERMVHTRPAQPSRSAPGPGDAATDERMYLILQRLKAYGGPNKVVLKFASMKREQWAGRIWESLHGRPNFVFRSALVQLFNPASAKGYALLKPSGTDRNDKSKDRWAEPFLEWLRYRGFFEGSAGWFTSGDFRLYCPIPGDILYDDLAVVARAFRGLRLGGTAVKMDCRATLGLTRLLIENASSYGPPRRNLRGVWVTHYKDMGQAHTVMAMEQLLIPDWFDLKTSQQAQLWLRTIDEHEKAIRRLDDSHSDELLLLQQYRKTLQRHRQESIVEFVDFLMGYGIHVFKQRAQDNWLLQQLSMANVAPIVGRHPDLQTILQNHGFQAVASAVRSATVGAQAARHHGNSDHREIRYGLLPEIRRCGFRGRRDLLELVRSFIWQFNSEGVNRRKLGIRSMRIENCELAEFDALLERLSPKVAVGPVLCALSTCLPEASGDTDRSAKLHKAASA